MKSWAIRIALAGAAFGVLTCLSSAWAPVARAPLAQDQPIED